MGAKLTMHDLKVAERVMSPGADVSIAQYEKDRTAAVNNGLVELEVDVDGGR